MYKLLTIGTMAVSLGWGAQLFNGKNLEGWSLIQAEGKDPFVVEDGVMHTTGFKGDAVYTAGKIGNAVIHVVYKMSNDHGNSGVFIRIPFVPKNEGDAINKGIEVQIDDEEDDYHSTGALYSMTKVKARPHKPAGEWNTLDITLDGPRTVVRLNGVLVTDYDGSAQVPPKVKPWEPDRGPRPETGYIALQAHDRSAVISFKEVSVEPFKK
jgi:predicted RecA/RadA family phage recombinase